MPVPPMEELLAPLEARAGGPIDVDRCVLDLDEVDSFDVLDWLYDMEERYGWGESVSDEVLLNIEDSTLRELYELLRSLVAD